MRSNSEKVLMKKYDYRYLVAASIFIYVFFMTVHCAVECFIRTPQTVTFGEFFKWIPLLGLATWNMQQNLKFYKKPINKKDNRPIQRDYEWVRGVIETSFDISHFEIALNIIEQFDKKYNDKVYLDWLVSYWKRRAFDNGSYLLENRIQDKLRSLTKQKIVELTDAGKN